MSRRPSSVIISSGDLHNVGDLALLLQCAYGVRRSLGVLDGKAPLDWAKAGAGSLVMVGGGQMVRSWTMARPSFGPRPRPSPFH